jgi:AraC family transcriptional regulator
MAERSAPLSSTYRVRRRPMGTSPTPPGVNVMREGRVEPLVHAHPGLSSAAAGWTGIAVEDHALGPCFLSRHEHIDDFLLVVTAGSARCEVLAAGRTLEFDANPGTVFVLPRGTVDEIRWKGSARRLTAAIGRNLLVNAMDGNERDVELTEHWNLTDPNIMAVLAAMTTDLHAGSLAGKLYGESLANSLAVYLLNRYGVRQPAPVSYRSGLPACRLNRVLDYIGDNLASDLSLSELASIAGMSPHHFIEMFRRSTGQAPYRYILLQRIERAKENLRDPKASVFEAGMDAGFQNASHFARVFRRFVGATPSQFRSMI